LFTWVWRLQKNCELFDYIAEPGKGFSEKVARFYFIQLITGLKSIHDSNLAHRDLKTENIFLDKGFNLKIGDFGFAKYMEENNSKKLSTILGTVGYQCPEMLENKGYSGVENDIFAAGVILFIFVNGYPPFKDATSKDPWYKNIYFGETKKFWDLHMKRLAIKTPSFLKLIERMLAKTNRITIDEILNSEWVKGELPSKDDLFNDLKERKVIVDSNREVKNSPKIVKLKNNEGAKTNNSKQYRAGIEDTLEKIDEMVNQLDISHFKTKRIEECGYDNYQSSAFLFQWK